MVRAAPVAGALVLGMLLAVPAFAVGIVGTNGPDVLRGTALDDRISARGGNDRVWGLGGNDTLTGGPGRDTLDGGPGADRLLMRDGAPDSARCGTGTDTVTADLVDTLRGDCERVLEPPAAQVTPPPRPVVAGRYEGRTSQGESLAFQVGGGGTVTGLVSTVHLSCAPTGSALAWALDLGDTVFPVRTDGSFTVDTTGTEAVGGVAAPFHAVVEGRFQSGLAAGTLALTVEHAVGAETASCTAPGVTWNAAAGILNEP